MSIEPIPVIELDQSEPKQRGQAYGEAARDKIQTILSAYHDIFHRITGETWDETVVRGTPLILKAKAFAPDLVEQVQGIAKGADRTF